MPDALLRPCAAPGCDEMVVRGRCPEHQRAIDRQRGTAAERGYGPKWRRFVGYFKHQLSKYGVVIACGARLPGAPITTDSKCAERGVLNGLHLEADHIIPHRGDPKLFWDLWNLQLLCSDCHKVKTGEGR